MDKLSRIQKTMLCYLGLATIFVLMGNSNNVPEIFAERIFKPIRGDSWRIHYSGLIVIVGIYYSLKQLNEMKKNSIIKTGFRRVIVTIVLISVFTEIWVYGIQFYKGFSKDLNSIYLDREKTLVQLNGNEDKVTIDGRIDIINCSNDEQEFYIKIKTPSLIKEGIRESYITLENEFKVHPKEEKTLIINEELKFYREIKYSGYSSEAFEYILFNEKDETIFRGKLEEYQWDELDSEN